MSNKENFYITDVGTGTIRFGLFNPITSRKEAEKFSREYEKRMKDCGLDVNVEVVKKD